MEVEKFWPKNLDSASALIHPSDLELQPGSHSELGYQALRNAFSIEVLLHRHRPEL